MRCACADEADDRDDHGGRRLLLHGAAAPKRDLPGTLPLLVELAGAREGAAEGNDAQACPTKVPRHRAGHGVLRGQVRSVPAI